MIRSPLVRTRNLGVVLGAVGLCYLASACSADEVTVLGNPNEPGEGNGGQTANNGGSGGRGGTGGSSSAGNGGTGDGGTGGVVLAMGGSPGTGGTDSTVAECPSHPNITAAAGRCEVTSSLASPITTALTLDKDHVWFLKGPVIIGNDVDETIFTVERGTTVFCGGEGSLILIQRGSKIIADGVDKTTPIVFTSARPVGERTPQDWGGLVINGRAPMNRPDNKVGDLNSQAGEAQTGRYGGTDAADNSGILRYVRVEFAGRLIDQENELNGIAFQGVGSGTTVDFVQVHMVQDDGIEFFGGTVNAKHLVVTGANDDLMDWTEGWSGKVQFVVAEELVASSNLSSDPRGMEADNINGTPAFNETPVSNPTLSNLTVIGRTLNGSGANGNGIHLRRGTKGQIWNSIIEGWGYCFGFEQGAPPTGATYLNIADGSLGVHNVVLGCTTGNVNPANTTPEAVTLFTTGVNNIVAGPALTPPPTPANLADPCTRGTYGCWAPPVGSPALAIGAGPTDPDSFFVAVDYAGAFSGEADDWAEGWTTDAVR